jgi:hypothetical protein
MVAVINSGGNTTTDATTTTVWPAQNNETDTAQTKDLFPNERN